MRDLSLINDLKDYDTSKEWYEEPFSNPRLYLTNILLKSSLEEIEEMDLNSYLYLLQEEEFPTDKEGNPTPTWLETVLGSTSEERRNSKPKSYQSYNRQVSKARRTLSSDFSLDKLLTNEEEYIIQLSVLEARFPTLTWYRGINVQELCQSKMKLLRSFLLYYYSLEVSPWIEMEIEESLDLILTKERLQSGGKTFRECFAIRQIFILCGRTIGMEILSQIYSKENIQRWIRTGKSLAISAQTVKIPYANPKTKIRRRGNRGSSTNNLKMKFFNSKRKGDPVMVTKSPESQELEEIKQRILKKQAILFEQRLDSFLQITSPSVPISQKRELFNQLVEINEEESQFEVSQQSNSKKEGSILDE